jgi:hypothetical protein
MALFAASGTIREVAVGLGSQQRVSPRLFSLPLSGRMRMATPIEDWFGVAMGVGVVVGRELNLLFPGFLNVTSGV